MIRFLTLIFVLLGLLYAGIGATLFYFQRSLLFAADRTDVAPADAGLPEADVHRLTTADGVSLVSWLVKGGDRLAIYFHGNSGSLASRGEPIRDLVDLGFSVLAIDYRGFGGSGGSPSEAGITLDADAAYEFARRLGYKPWQMFLYGESLGTAVAVSLATRRDVAGVILDAPFSSIADIAADRYWMFPVRHFIRDPFRSDLVIAQVSAPILMLHGSADDVVPIESGRRLFASAPADAEFMAIEDADHVVLGNERANDRIRSWLAGITGTSRVSQSSPETRR